LPKFFPARILHYTVMLRSTGIITLWILLLCCKNLTVIPLYTDLTFVHDNSILWHSLWKIICLTSLAEIIKGCNIIEMDAWKNKNDATSYFHTYKLHRIQMQVKPKLDVSFITLDQVCVQWQDSSVIWSPFHICL